MVNRSTSNFQHAPLVNNFTVLSVLVLLIMVRLVKTYEFRLVLSFIL